MMQELATALESLEYQRDVKLVTFFGAGQVLLRGLRARRPPRRPRLHDARELPAHLREPRQARQADARGGGGPGARRRLHARGRLRHRARGARAPSSATPRSSGGVFNTVAAALLPRLVGRKRAFEILLTGASLTRGRRRAGRARHARRARRQARGRGGGHHPALPGVERADRCSARRRAIAGGLDLPFADAVRHAEDVYLNQLWRRRTSRRACGPWPRSASRPGRTGERGRARLARRLGHGRSRRASSTRPSSPRCGCARPASTRG